MILMMMKSGLDLIRSNGSLVKGPLQAPVNTNFEHMGVMENPHKNALQLSSSRIPNYTAPTHTMATCSATK